jgi:hypothetical protein
VTTEPIEDASSIAPAARGSEEPTKKAGLRARGDLAFLFGVSLLLLVPLCCVPNLQTGRAGAGVPLVFGGDEPHYLVLLNSILDDGDLDLRNNYDAAERGGLQAGRGYRGARLDRHVAYWIGPERVTWKQLFGDGARPERVDAAAFAALPQYPAHYVGLAALLAPSLFPLRGSPWLEPAALTMAAVAVIVAMVLFARLLGGFTESSRTVRITIVAVFLGTPVWAHARTLFAEPFLVLCVVGAFWAALKPEPSFLSASVFLAVGAFMKPQVVLLIGPLLWLAATRRDWKSALRLLPLPTLSLGAILLLNRHLYGSLWRGPYPFYGGDLLEGAVGLLFSTEHGLFSTGPILALAVAGLPHLVRERPVRGGILSAAVLLVFSLTAAWRYWEGGYCYGPRLLVPVIPLLGVGLVKAFDSALLRRPVVQWGAYGLMAASVTINLVAATHYWYSWDANPWALLRGLLLLYG